MHDIRKIDMQEDILAQNDAIADSIKEHMASHGVLTVNEMGAPGVGKTTTIKNIVNHLKEVTPHVIEGDIESDIDTQDLNSLGIDTFQINTYGACHLDAPLVEHALEHMGVGHHGSGHGSDTEDDVKNSDNEEKRDILFIENVGNLVCPAEFSIGEHIMLLISSVTEGSDKPYKYPLAFEKADIIILNKVDLMPYLDFDEEFFMKGVRALNKDVPVFKVSGTTGEGFDEVAAWFEQKAKEL